MNLSPAHARRHQATRARPDLARIGRLIGAGVVGASVCLTGASAQSPADPWGACNAAASQAEREFGIPGGLLAAIGMVESGRWNGASRRSAPWPYAIDVGGYDLFMDSLDAAAGRVRALQAGGLRSIDVGCFQINLMHHPDAFTTIEEGFDPAANAAYAARFLKSLLQHTGSWQAAVAAYHSFAPSLGEPYRARVYASWSGASGEAPDASSVPGPAVTMHVPAGWGWTPVISVHVIVPSLVAPLATPGIEPRAAHGQGPWGQQFSGSPGLSKRHLALPRVFTPSNG